MIRLMKREEEPVFPKQTCCYVVSGLLLLKIPLLLYSAQIRFSPGTPVFPCLQNPTSDLT